jgi:hypothetical protein
MTEVQATYAVDAGKAARADFAMRADDAERAESAKVAEQAKQATYAMISREAERLNVAGTIAYIDSTNHYLIMYVEGTDPGTGMIFDILNHSLMNVDSISDSGGTSYSKDSFMLTEQLGSSEHALSGLGGLKLQDKIDALTERVSQLETQLATFTQT